MSQPSRLFSFIPRPSSWSTPRLLWTAAIFITLASLWRLVHLDHLLVWHDEALSVVRVLGYSIEEINQLLFSGQLLTPEQLLRFQHLDSAYGWADTWRALATHPEHGPLYYLLGRLILIIPLEPIIGLRAVAAIMSALLPLATFWFMRELFGRTEQNWPVAWVAAALTAVSPLYVLYAHEARQYTLWLLLLVLSSAALLRLLRTPQRRWWWLYGALMTLSFYTHLLSALTVLIHAGYGLLHLSMRRIDASHSPRVIIRSWLFTIVIATFLFTPWLGVILHQHQLLFAYTSWMGETTVPVSTTLYAWGVYLTRTFIDFSSALPTWSLFALVPITAAVAIYLRRAPRPAGWLLPLVAFCFIGIVLVPDVLFGGVRSMQLRYAFPALFAVQCMVAWVIGTALIPAATTTTRFLTPRRAGVILNIIITTGILSLALIDRSSTWWSKNYNENNDTITQRINAQPAALLLVSNSFGVSVGKMLSLAYHLHPDVRIWGEPMTGATANILPPTGSGERFAFLPWATLVTALAPDTITPIDGSVQWFRIESATAAASQSSTTNNTSGRINSTVSNRQPLQ